jgi:hypothetical protein
MEGNWERADGVTFAMKCLKPDVKSYEVLGLDGEM